MRLRGWTACTPICSVRWSSTKSRPSKQKSLKRNWLAGSSEKPEIQAIPACPPSIRFLAGSSVRLSLPSVTGSKETVSGSDLLLKFGRLPERPKGADCKSAGNAYGGSNPSSATQREIPGTTRFRGFFAFQGIGLPPTAVDVGPSLCGYHPL